MYRILVDGKVLYNPVMPEYSILSGKLSQELNTSGLLTLTIPQSNPSYGEAQLMKSVVQLYDDNELLFEGRPYAPNYNLYKDNELTIEGELAYLNDSIYSPYSFNGTVSDFFTSLINSHNSQVDERRQFVVGNIDVVNSTIDGLITRSDEDYKTTWSIIKEKLLSKLDGYLFIRHEQGQRIIDYVSDLNYLHNQPIIQAINLVNATKEINNEDLATVILPLGAKTEKEDGTVEYVTIESVNESMYLEDTDAIQCYGRIVKVCHHDDITIPQNLLRAAQNDLQEAIGLSQTISITASDLHKAGYSEYDSFRIGQYVDVKVKNLDIDERMLVRKLTIDLLNPGSNQLSVGKEERLLTLENYKSTTRLEEKIVRVEQQITEKTINAALQTLREVSALIASNAEELRSSFTESYYDKNNVDNLLAQISTTIQQTANAITLSFNSFQSSQNQLNGEATARFEEISSYIRFENGNILLGKEGNAITLKIENDKISFLDGNTPVAYWENQRFNVTDAYFNNSIKIGKFAIVPRTSGGLSIKKVGN